MWLRFFRSQIHLSLLLVRHLIKVRSFSTQVHQKLLPPHHPDPSFDRFIIDAHNKTNQTFLLLSSLSYQLLILVITCYNTIYIVFPWRSILKWEKNVFLSLSLYCVISFLFYIFVLYKLRGFLICCFITIINFFFFGWIIYLVF